MIAGRVLVTGAGGFIGRRCLSAFRSYGFEVHATARTDTQVLAAHSVHEIDLLDASGARRLLNNVRPTHLLHLAWHTSPGTYWNSPENYGWLRRGMDLFESFYDCGGIRAVGVGSCAEYGQPSTGACHETGTPLLPTTAYGSAKAALGAMLRCHGLTFGHSWAWARIFFPYGPGEPATKLFSSILASLKSGRLPDLREPTRRLDFIHVDDVARILVAAVQGDYSGPFNVGSTRAVTIGEVCREIIVAHFPDLLASFDGRIYEVGCPGPDIYADAAPQRGWFDADSMITVADGAAGMSVKCGGP